MELSIIVYFLNVLIVIYSNICVYISVQIVTEFITVRTRVIKQLQK